jgi:hypothetical protein
MMPMTSCGAGLITKPIYTSCGLRRICNDLLDMRFVLLVVLSVAFTPLRSVKARITDVVLFGDSYTGGQPSLIFSVRLLNESL